MSIKNTVFYERSAVSGQREAVTLYPDFAGGKLQ